MPGFAAISRRTPVRPVEFAARSLPAGVILMVLAELYSSAIIGGLLPVIRAEIPALDDNIAVSSLEFVSAPGGDALRFRADLTQPIYTKKGAVFPLAWNRQSTAWFQVDLNARRVLQGPVIFLILMLSWPWGSRCEYWLRIPVAIPLLAVLFALDAPLDLLGNFREEVYGLAQPAGIRALSVWDGFLEGGGSAALAISAALISIALSRRISRPAAEAHTETDGQ